MIHSGLPFYNPFLSVGGVALNWALQAQPSPPASPPSTTSSVAATKLSSFTIDAILGRHQQHPEGAGGAIRDRRYNRDERFERLNPYPSASISRTVNTNSVARTSPSSGNSGCTTKTKSKRVRTIFTAEQLERLEAEFAVQQYMVGPERLYLAATLQLTEAQVKVWFQNRRIKYRKAMVEQQQASLVQSPNCSREEGPTNDLPRPISPTTDNEESTSSDRTEPSEEVSTSMDHVLKSFEPGTQCPPFANSVSSHLNSSPNPNLVHYNNLKSENSELNYM